MATSKFADGTFVGAARRLDDIDLPRIGHTIGVGEDEIHAFMDVEAAGTGFDSRSRPKMLFEPHVFYRNLTGAQRTLAVSQGLAYGTWGQQKYPSDSYPRLEKAIAINETAALRSASWGLGQILGENYAAAGYADVASMVAAFMEDEEHHLAAMVAFLKSNGLDDDLREHRWQGLARGYNGAGYAKNKYDTRLAAAYEKWRRIPDTPWLPSEDKQAGSGTTLPAIPRTRIGRGDRGDLVQLWQNILVVSGAAIVADRVFGPATEAATIRWQSARGLLADGVVGPKTWAAADAKGTAS